MAAFTILNHGTAFDRQMQGELIAEFGRVMSGREARVVQCAGQPSFVDGDYMINEGPGSAIATRPGAVNPFTMEQRGWGYTLSKRTLRSGFKRDFYGNTEYTTQLAGKVTGAGWDDNIYKTLFVLSNKLDNFPGTINMIGWSRGAVTCLRIAMALQEKIREGLFLPVSMNLFLIDPVVGGPTTREFGMDHIAPLVDRLVGILSMHENRPGFSPLSADKMYKHREADSQDIIYLPMPGVHSDQVSKGGKFSDSADVTWNLAYKFLSSVGTKFSGLPRGFRPLNSPGEMCDAYARMILAGMDLPWFNRRNFSNHRHRYVTNHDYFVNKHHQLVFQRAFPNLYQTVFCGGGGVPAANLIRTQTFHPDIFRSLERAGVLRNAEIKRPSNASDTRFSFSWPRGIPLC